jgi:two-component system, chemotaxis family, chemotaxis protein CheY
MLILAVDDTRSLLELLVMTLRSAGHEVVQATDGLEAQERFAERRPDLVISDLNMPNCDGIEFTRACRARVDSAGVPIIILTTETDPDLKAEARRAGASAWMNKPFDPPTLLGLVDRMAA